MDRHDRVPSGAMHDEELEFDNFSRPRDARRRKDKFDPFVGFQSCSLEDNG